MTPTSHAQNWHDPPRGLVLARDEVHVWRIALDPPGHIVERLASFLSADEQARAARFLALIHRTRFQVARGTLRAILGRYLGREPGRIEFAYGEHGKPFLPGIDLRFNMAHSKDVALLGVSDGRELGIDIEAVRPLEDAERIVARFFSAREQADFFRVIPAERQEAFFRGWVRKEAYIKAIGMGLALPLADFDVTLAPGEPPRLLHVANQPDAPARWTFGELDPGAGFQGAIAVEGGGWRLCGFAARGLWNEGLGHRTEVSASRRTGVSPE
ncbi:MAG: 4'-phosphopantetheinyl transferase superfamily protein [Isosphaeraceae bacterium]|nr:4'-phosphopantetheinyl transferase superfamily protein [Isosphaeraceae bacterium]